MKVIMGLLIACLFCFMSVPVEASSFGISPAVISVKAIQGGSSTFFFTVSSYTGLVEITSEGMPVTISPSSVNAVAGTPISVVISCNSNANPGTYDGRIKFLAKSGNSVLAGINVICNLIVAGASANVTLTTTVVGNGNGGGGGSFDSGDSIPYTPPNWASIFPSMNQPQSSAPTDSRTVQQNPPIYIPPVVPQSNTYVPPVTPVVEERDSSKDNLMYVFIGLGALLIGLVIYLILPEQRVR
jgi:hypothetical protein